LNFSPKILPDIQVFLWENLESGEGKDVFLIRENP
jgi:hypothetical protein